MTQIRSVTAGLEQLADAPALIHGQTVLSGTRVLAEARRMADGPRGHGDPQEAPEELCGRLADLLANSDEPAGLVDRLRRAYGDAVRKVAVLGNYAGAAGDAVLAAWAAGAVVVCGSDASSPARALALLERTGADRAFLPAGLLCALPEHPSAALADLRALRVVVYSDKELTDSQKSLVSSALDVTVSYVPVPHPGGERHGAPTEDDFTEAARAATRQGVTGIDLHAAVGAVGAMSHTALLSMLDTLYRQGLFASGSDRPTEAEVLTAARVTGRYHGLVRRWLAALTAEGLLRRDGDRFQLTLSVTEFTGLSLEQAWDEAEKAWRTTVGSARTVDYARRSAALLPELLSGETDAVSLLFPQGGMGLAESLYRESVTARYQHHAVGGLLGAVAARWPHRRPLRVLEVGAGTGATTERALPALTASGADLTYLFTDVTPFFLERARQRWGTMPAIGFGRLDIDVPPREQGFAPGAFDIVLSGGVLNAARDTDASLRSLTGLLAPDGWLVLTEPTAEEYWVMITQAFLMTDAQDARTRTGATFLSLAQWRAALDAAGLRRVVDLPEPDHPLDRLGHRVFATRPV